MRIHLDDPDDTPGTRRLSTAGRLMVILLCAFVAAGAGWAISEDLRATSGSTRELELSPAARYTACVERSVGDIAGSDVAFEAVVTSIGWSGVRFRTGRTWVGTVSVSVTVRTRPDTAPLAETFRPGDVYLVAAAHGVVLGCGGIERRTTTRQEFFESAFGGHRTGVDPGSPASTVATEPAAHEVSS